MTTSSCTDKNSIVYVSHTYTCQSDENFAIRQTLLICENIIQQTRAYISKIEELIPA